MSTLFRILIRPLTSLWAGIASLRLWAYQNGLLRRERLRARVISIGNISFGGTGKTPFTIWLAEKLTAQGYRVSILARGYKRASQGVRVIPPGVDWRFTLGDAHSYRNDGDEAQLYRRHLPQVAIGIADRRYDAGRELEAQFSTDVHLLDDGFQHLALERDLDIVLIDASNPWGNRGNLPQPLRHSRQVLRESPQALSRAQLIVLTRSEMAAPSGPAAPGQTGGPSLAEITAFVRGFQPAAPILHARTRLLHFMDDSGQLTVSIEQVRQRRVAAFCGLGHPENFFAMLERAGIHPVAQRVFKDHTLYGGLYLNELVEMARSSGADCLVTSEKDLVNSRPPNDLAVPLYWAVIQLEVAEEEALLDQVVRCIGPPGAAPEPSRQEGPPALPATRAS